MAEPAPIIYAPIWKRVRLRLAILGTLLLALSVTAVLLWPGFANTQSLRYLESAAQTNNVQTRELDLKLSLWLQPNNPDAYLSIVKLYLSQGRQAEAEALFTKAGSSAEASRTQVLIYNEEGRGEAATAAAKKLLTGSRTDEDRLLATLTFIASGDRTSADATMASLGPSDALQRAKRARSSNDGLGIELAAAGLPNSAERFLVKQPVSFVRNTTLGDIYAVRDGQANLAKARDYYQSALTFKPDSIPVHQKLAVILTSLGDTAGASAQQTLIGQLRNGGL